MATQASADPTAPKPRILRIGIIQGGRIVEERLVRKRENISVGQSAKNMFVVPSDALPRTWMLFEATAKGYVAHFGEGMDARIAVGQEIISLAQMKQGGKIQKTGQSWDMVLDERARGKITVGDLTILFQFVTPPPPQPRPQLPASVRGSFTANLDWFFTSMTVGSFVIHLCLIIYLRSVDWPKKPDIEEIPDRFVQMVVKKKVEPPKEDKKPDEKKPDEKKPDDVAKKQPKKDDAPAPKKELTEAEKQKIAEDKAKADAERRAKIAEQVQNTGILKLLGARADGEGAIADVLGKGDVDRDQEKAFEGVGGLTVATGDDGLRGVKSGTGGSGKVASISGLRGGGNIEGGSTGVGAGEKSVKGMVRNDAPSVDGEIDPASLAKDVKRNLNGIKACYERGLKTNGKLQGKITVRWTITPAGTVTGVEVDDGVGDGGVADCIKKTVSRWRFAAHPGGPAEVSFPFVFAPSS